MNLLTNRIIFKKTGLLLLVILFFLACKKEKNTIGLNDPSRLPSDALFTDTITIKSSVVLIGDSINTTNVVGLNSSSDMMAGAYHDPLLGDISAEAYTKLLLVDQYKELPAAVIDTAYLFLSYSYYYGNLAQSQTLEVYELTEDIRSDVTYFSNSAPLSRYGTPIGTITLNASADSATAITIPLTDANGFLTRILNGSKNNSDFQSEIKGIVIVPVNNNVGSIIRFDGNSGNSALHIHYTQYGESGVYKLQMGTTARKFFRVTADRSGTELASLVNQYDSISTDVISSNRGYLQACTGIRTRLSFPYLKKLREAFPNIAIIRGELLIYPSPGTDNFAPNNSLLMMRTEGGKIKKTSAGAVYYVQPDDYTQYANASINVSTLYNNQYYYFPVKSYVQAVLIEQVPNNPIILSPALMYNEINRLAFDNNSKSGGLPFKLKLYFTTTK